MAESTQRAVAAPDTASMSDFIFGTLATDELRIASLKSGRRGLAHNYEISPRDPKPSQPVKIEVSAGPDAPITEVFIHYTTDGTQPMIGKPNTRTVPTTRTLTEWDTMLWGYVRQFAGELPGQPEGTIVRYQVSGLTQDSQRFWAQDAQGFERFSYVVDRHQTPAWVQDSVMYHILVDRFAPTPGREFDHPNGLAGFYGGTLRGILGKMDYLSDLGVNALWLSPVFPSPSHHGYDVTNFRKVEARLGTKTDLKELIDELHRRNMRLILDFVPNHTSNQHPFFESAATSPDSPYRDYYSFTQWPEEYETFFGIKTLPKLNNETIAARQHVIESAVFWLNDLGVDGFRLDYAQGPSHDFWTDYYAAVKRSNPQSFHFGEIVEPPPWLHTYEGVLDGVLDFTWLQIARKLFAHGTASVADFEQFQAAHESFFVGRNFTRLSFLDNHDMNRFLWVGRGNTKRLKMAAVCQFTLGALPIIYYGTEVGLSQQRDVRQDNFHIPEESRLPMLWGKEQSKELFKFYQKLIKLRRESTALRQGTRWAWLVDPLNGRYGYLRRASTQTMAVAFNLSGVQQTFDLPSVTWRDAFTGEVLPSRINIEPCGFAIARQG